MRNKQIAEAFSNGKFEITYPYLSSDIEWTIIGENEFTGRQAVIDNCEKTSEYFKTVNTDFRILNVIASENLVAINGTAEFSLNNERILFISACDVYEFNDKSEIVKITSYCIPDKL